MNRLRQVRLRAQLLTGTSVTAPEAVVGRLLAVQAQDPRGFRLAVRSRSSGLTAQDVDRSLADRRLVVSWLNRGTLHLVRSEDYGWLHSLTAPRNVTGTQRRLHQEGVSPAQAERGVATIIGSIESEGPLGREQLRDRLDAAGVPTEGQALVHLLVAASHQGLVVRGPVVDGAHAFVSVAEWLGPTATPPDREEALRSLALRYLAGHEPATAEDLAKWAGITLGDARAAYGASGDDLRMVPGGVARRTTDLDDVSPLPPRLLGPFDPLLHGWASREPFVGVHGSVVTTNGIFRPVCMVGGQVVGTWAMPSGGVVIDLLEPIGKAPTNALLADAAAVQQYLGVDGPEPRVQADRGRLGTS